MAHILCHFRNVSWAVIGSGLLCASLVPSFSWAQTSPLEVTRGLKRFSPDTELGERSHYQIKQIYIGDNVLASAIMLETQGGEVQYISGGSRSRRVQIRFTQPYADTRLVQTVELNFDKDNGFITSVRVNYKLASAYVNVAPVLDNVLASAVEKYGEPLSFTEVQQIAENATRLKAFIAGLAPRLPKDKDVKQAIEQFFSDKIVTDKTGFERDSQGRALLKSGFNQCYLWPHQNYTEWLTLCSFQPDSGNMRGRGIDLYLTNFSIHQTIAAYQHRASDFPLIDL